MSASQTAACYRINSRSAHMARRAELFPAGSAESLSDRSFSAAAAANYFCLYSFHFMLHFPESPRSGKRGAMGAKP